MVGIIDVGGLRKCTLKKNGVAWFNIFCVKRPEAQLSTEDIFCGQDQRHKLNNPLIFRRNFTTLFNKLEVYQFLGTVTASINKLTKSECFAVCCLATGLHYVIGVTKKSICESLNWISWAVFCMILFLFLLFLFFFIRFQLTEKKQIIINIYKLITTKK